MIIGLATGCFDLLHEGHLHFLQEARSKCEYLVLAVNHDDSVRRLKGEGRPVQRVAQRMYAILDRGSAWVDAVIPFDGAKGFLAQRVRPTIFCAGYDMQITGGFAFELREINCTISKISYLPGYSTSLQLEQAQAKTSA
jgi:D-beta-D-heptose 7-phosphate kinase/D-beta-D-heptose 1-phosphate adenosyltransferase